MIAGGRCWSKRAARLSPEVYVGLGEPPDYRRRGLGRARRATRSSQKVDIRPETAPATIENLESPLGMQATRWRLSRSSITRRSSLWPRGEVLRRNGCYRERSKVRLINSIRCQRTNFSHDCITLNKVREDLSRFFKSSFLTGRLFCLSMFGRFRIY